MKLRLLAALLAPFWLANCATIVEGTDQSVQVASDPAGAACDLKRAGASVGYVASTPGAVQLTKSKESVAVTCAKAGYLDETAILQSGFQGMTFGNILFGGLIGAAVDASSGAMHKYPPSISLKLPPEAFPTPEERDRYFSERMASVRSDAEAAKKVVKDQCGENSGENKGCVRQQKDVDAQLDRELDRIEAQKSAAKVAS